MVTYIESTRHKLCTNFDYGGRKLWFIAFAVSSWPEYNNHKHNKNDDDEQLPTTTTKRTVVVIMMTVAWSRNTTMKNHVATFEGKTCHSKSPTSVKILLRITMFLQYFCLLKGLLKQLFAFEKEFEVLTDFHHFWKRLTEPTMITILA